MNSEKYEIRVREWAAQPNLDDEIRLLNGLRRRHPALRLQSNLRFHMSETRDILFYSKLDETDADDREDLLIAVNLDPLRANESMVHVPLDLLDIPETAAYGVEDLLTGTKYTWRG